MKRMTTVDGSVPFIRVLMVKQDYDRYPAFSLPAGFSFINYNENLSNDWIRIQTATGNAAAADAAKEIIDVKLREESIEAGENDFIAQLEKRMIFVRDGENIAATACLWFGNHFERQRSKLHWVAVAPEYQGRGLAKAMLTKLLDINLEIKLSLYLVSTTQNCRAIAIYKLFGFEPYMGEAPPNWRLSGVDAPEFEHLSFEEKNSLAWGIIDGGQNDAQ